MPTELIWIGLGLLILFVLFGGGTWFVRAMRGRREKDSKA